VTADADQLQGLDFSLARDAELPLGTQLTWKLRAMIATGRLAPGARLPGARQLAGAADVNVNTVRAVYNRLEEAGLIDAHHGRGTFVSAAAGDDASLRGIAETAADEARRAGLDPRELAAALYFEGPASTRSPGPTRPRAGGDVAERATRTRLRRQITALERALAGSNAPASNALPGRTPSPSRGGRLLSIAELEEVRDDLLDRLLADQDGGAPRDLAAAERPKRKASKADAPWSLRWDTRTGRLLWSGPYGH